MESAVRGGRNDGGPRDAYFSVSGNQRFRVAPTRSRRIVKHLLPAARDYPDAATLVERYGILARNQGAVLADYLGSVGGLAEPGRAQRPIAKLVDPEHPSERAVSDALSRAYAAFSYWRSAVRSW
jgi:hypothetical protein